MTARHVLHVAQPTTAGVARVVADLVHDQLARGWTVSVACPPDGWLPDEVRAAGAHWLAWPATRDPGPSVPAETLRLRRLIRTAAPDLVHLHSSKAGLAGRLALRGRTATVFQPHAWSMLAGSTAVRRAARAWERLGARWVDRIAVVSEEERRQGLRAGIAGPYALVPNGVDTDRRAGADRDDARRRLGLEPAPWAVCAGRVCRQKGQDLLLAAWPQVLQDVPTAQLAIVGDGPDLAALAATAPPGVLLPGGAEDVDTWLAAADVVVLPSRWEGASLLLLEAMASGRSVVAGRADGMQEALRSDAGVVVDAENAAALADAIVRRLTDPTLATAEGETGRRRVRAEYDLSITTGRVAVLYDEVLARRH
jgi:glycosyltransferase involved in cell wall biosynthesis